MRLTGAGMELCTGVHLPIVFEEGIIPFVKHLADITASAQRASNGPITAADSPHAPITAADLPLARPFEMCPAMWMPFASTEEYVAFLKGDTSTLNPVPCALNPQP